MRELKLDDLMKRGGGGGPCGYDKGTGHNDCRPDKSKSCGKS